MISKLGAFVRAHRERIAPDSIGLPLGDRRRTPGLRREKLAALCGVSATWITWLEQGRPVSASAKTLARLATALRLSEAERSYLFKLGDKVDPEARIKDLTDAKAREVSKLVGVIKSPAYVLDRQWNAVAWTSDAAQLFSTWLGSESPDGERNLHHSLSMDGRGCWRDNVFVERLWKSIKYEEVYLRAYETVSAARSGIARYIDFYNSRRPHSSLDGITPDAFYFKNLPAMQRAA
jgi:transcriptional regulator with XRE-family HTH domain